MRAELGALRRRAELLQRLLLNLAHALPRQAVAIADLLQRELRRPFEPEAEAKHVLLSLAEAREQTLERRDRARATDLLVGQRRRAIDDEIAELRLAVGAHGRLQREGLGRDVGRRAHLLQREAAVTRDLVLRRLLSGVARRELALRARDLVLRLDHVHRHANRLALIRERARHLLLDPPRRIRAESVAAAVVELVDGAHQADVPLLDQVEQIEARHVEALRDLHDEAHVRLDEQRLGAVGARAPAAHRGGGARALRGDRDAVDHATMEAELREVAREALARRDLVAVLHLRGARARAPEHAADLLRGLRLGDRVVLEIAEQVAGANPSVGELREDRSELVERALRVDDRANHVGLAGLDLAREANLVRGREQGATAERGEIRVERVVRSGRDR